MNRPRWLNLCGIECVISFFLSLSFLPVIRNYLGKTKIIMAPAATLDWSEPCQHWRYPKFCPSGQQKHERAKSAMELSSKEANSAYKKFYKFLRRLKNRRRKLTGFRLERRIIVPRIGLASSNVIAWTWRNTSDTYTYTYFPSNIFPVLFESVWNLDLDPFERSNS